MQLLRRRRIWILLAALIVLVIVAVAVGIAYLLLRQPQGTAGGWKDPISAVAPADVAPDLALYPLAGASELEAIDAAIDNGELMTAFAALAFSPDPSDRQRVGRLTVLAERLAEAGSPDLASLAYQEIYDVALLSPLLNDPLRIDALRVVGEGWTQLGKKERAVLAYEQMVVVAAYSPYLQTAQRREVLSVVEDAYVSLGQTESAKEVQDRIRELEQQVPSQEAGRFAQPAGLPLGQDSISSPEVGILEEARRQAAYSLVQSFGRGEEASSLLISNLAEALKAEDSAKLTLYRQELEGSTQLSRRIGIEWQMIHWFLLKYRIAQKAYGLSLVPEWETQLADIQSALSKLYEDLLFDYEDLVTGLPDASLLAPGRYQARRLLTLAGRLGHWPNYPADQQVEKLRAAAEDLIAAGYVDDVYLDALREGTDIEFVYRAGIEYGQPVPSP